jgi:hypothetical protein
MERSAGAWAHAASNNKDEQTRLNGVRRSGSVVKIRTLFKAVRLAGRCDDGYQEPRTANLVFRRAVERAARDTKVRVYDPEFNR